MWFYVTMCNYVVEYFFKKYDINSNIYLSDSGDLMICFFKAILRTRYLGLSPLYSRRGVGGSEVFPKIQSHFSPTLQSMLEINPALLILIDRLELEEIIT